MAEVFSISGAGNFGFAPCPAGWATTPKGNCGAPLASCPANMRVQGACRDPRAVALQTALKALGQATGDKTLAAIGVDGFIGPQTTALANRAFTTHIGAGQAAARFRTGVMEQAQVANEAGLMASVINAEIQRRGAVAPAPRQFVAKAAPPPEPGAGPAPVPAIYAGMPPRMWALVGLSALLAATGGYMAYADRAAYA